MAKTEGATLSTKILYGVSALSLATAPTTYQQTGAKPREKAADGQRYNSEQGADRVMVYDERLIDARLEAVEARTETKFAQLLGKLDLVSAGIGDLKGKIGELDTKIGTVDGHTRSAKREVIAAVVTTGLAVAALAWAGVQIFQSGLGLSASAFQVGAATAEQKKIDDTKGSDRAK